MVRAGSPIVSGLLSRSDGFARSMKGRIGVNDVFYQHDSILIRSHGEGMERAVNSSRARSVSPAAKTICCSIRKWLPVTTFLTILVESLFVGW